MLTFDECKAVAEEVWGWVKKDWYFGDNLLPAYVSPDNKDAVAERDLVDYEVNSWEGFGWTVEAMEKRHLVLNIVGSCVFFRNKSRMDDGFGYSTNRVGLNTEQLRDATHRAALGAVRKEKV